MRATFRFGMDDVRHCETWQPRWHYDWHAYYGDLPEVWRMNRLAGLLMRYVPAFKKSFVMLGYRLHA